MSARHHFVRELTLAAANVAWTNKIIAEQRRRVARVKCRGGDNGDAEDLLEMMLEVWTHHQGVHNLLLHAVLIAAARPAMAY